MVESDISILRKKEGRGIFLIVILLLHTFVAVFFFLILINGIFALGNIDKIKGFNFETLFISLAIFILVVSTAPLMWRWSKWGVYGLILLFFVWLLEYYLYELPKYLVAAHQTNTPAYFIIYQTLETYTVFSILYFWAIKRKWHLFS